MNDNNTNTCGSCGTNKCCSCGHHYIIPSAIVLIGLSFLLQRFGIIEAQITSVVWPVLVIVIGVTKFCGCCKKY